MSPKRAKTIRIYSLVHAALGNPLRATYRALKRSVTHSTISGKAKGKLLKRIKLLSQRPVYLRPDGTGELRMAGFAAERGHLSIARRKNPRPDDAVWELQVHPEAAMLQRMNLPLVRYVVPLG